MIRVVPPEACDRVAAKREPSSAAADLGLEVGDEIDSQARPRLRASDADAGFSVVNARYQPLLTVLIPTYNEAGNIQIVLRGLSDALAGIHFEVMVVDDCSPDGTAAIVRELSSQDRRIQCIVRAGTRGLSESVIEGLQRSTGEYIVVMDADGQHPPSAVPRFLSAAAEGRADLVVGSRYSPGGTEKGFPWYRRLISWGARRLAVASVSALRKHGLRDVMSGFFLVRRSALPPLAHLRPKGYKILLELLAAGTLQRTLEVGYAFGSRAGGESKLTLRTQLDYLVHLGRLARRDRENRRFAAFGLVGLTGVIVNLAPLAAAQAALGETNPTRLLLWAILARELAILWNFTWNELVSFRDLRAATGRTYADRLWRFHVASLGSAAVYAAAFSGLTHASMPALHAATVAIILGFLSNYLFARKWTYAKSGRAGEPVSAP